MTQQVIAFLTGCEEARSHLRKLRVIVEHLPLEEWIRGRMMAEIDGAAKALGLMR